jgi:hypothetical protein
MISKKKDVTYQGLLDQGFEEGKRGADLVIVLAEIRHIEYERVVALAESRHLGLESAEMVVLSSVPGWTRTCKRQPTPSTAKAVVSTSTTRAHHDSRPSGAPQRLSCASRRWPELCRRGEGHSKGGHAATDPAPSRCKGTSHRNTPPRPPSSAAAAPSTAPSSRPTTTTPPTSSVLRQHRAATIAEILTLQTSQTAYQ